MEIEKTLRLMKKTGSQPILFHLLHSHLVFLLSKESYTPADDWERIFVASAQEKSSLPQSVESKILNFLKTSRSRCQHPDESLRIVAICYYLLSKPAHLVNQFIICELLGKYTGLNDYIDGLIITILNKLTTAKAFKCQENRRIRPESFEWMVGLVAGKEVSLGNRIKLLASILVSSKDYFSLKSISFRDTFLCMKFLEYAYIYAKHAKDSSVVRNTLPDSEEFVSLLKAFMSFEYAPLLDSAYNVEAAFIPASSSSNRGIVELIRREFSVTENKSRLLSVLKDIIDELERKS